MRALFAILVLGLLTSGCLGGSPPATTTTTPAIGSVAQGKAMMGPTCPVVRDPPDPACADRPFEGNLSVTSADGARDVATFATNATGAFHVELPPGDYAIASPRGGAMLPRCQSDPFHVASDAWTTINVSCDTGIR